jgi:hypothetical protein
MPKNIHVYRFLCSSHLVLQPYLQIYHSLHYQLVCAPSTPSTSGNQTYSFVFTFSRQPQILGDETLIGVVNPSISKEPALPKTRPHSHQSSIRNPPLHRSKYERMLLVQYMHSQRILPSILRNTRDLPPLLKWIYHSKDQCFQKM